MLGSNFKYWSQWRKAYGNEGFAEFGQHLHHWLLRRNGATKGSGVMWWLKNQMWNLKPMKSASFHTFVHGKGRNAFNVAEQLWYGTPTWFRAATFGTGGDVMNQIP